MFDATIEMAQVFTQSKAGLAKTRSTTQTVLEEVDGITTEECVFSIRCLEIVPADTAGKRSLCVINRQELRRLRRPDGKSGWQNFGDSGLLNRVVPSRRLKITEQSSVGAISSPVLARDYSIATPLQR